jgi:tRNA(fMet)-specific endonuclease VapC
LQTHVENFRDILIFPFDKAAFERLDSLRKVRLGVGTMDLKIAAICLAHDATLLTRNLRDFQKVPGLKAEDWTQ